MNKEKELSFDALCTDVAQCYKCVRMNDSTKLLNRAVGSLSAELMFIGEAPGRLGADKSAIPFHGDKAGHNFEALLEYANIDRARIYVTNAVLCNPKAEDGNNATPELAEIVNCHDKLARQIEIVRPTIIVTLGATALHALAAICAHDYKLRTHVRTLNNWNDRKLIPLYHPGQRAMIHRSYANQRSDYQFVSDTLKKLGRTGKSTTGATKYDVAIIVRELIRVKGVVSYFALHKLFYLLEYRYWKTNGTSLTRAFFVRQKDGPYCTDLHIAKLKAAIPDLRIANQSSRLVLSLSADLFAKGNESFADTGVISIINNYLSLTDDKLKTASYMTKPMRDILRREHSGINMMNAPIQFIASIKHVLN